MKLSNSFSISLLSIAAGIARVTTSANGEVEIHRPAYDAFTNSGTKGLGACVISYILT